MDGIQGAILRVKLQYLEGWTESRRRIAAMYQERLGNLGLRLSQEVPGRRHVYHIFSVFHPNRDALRAHLDAAGIQTGFHYPVPVHLQKAYAGLGHSQGEFPVTEQTAREQLSLPIYPEMPDQDVERVCEAVRAWIA
jgi:dTDP-4-amino-4,6-dideoxygalactose transaminase